MNKKSLFSIGKTFLAIILLILSGNVYSGENFINRVKRIAHAGGGYNGDTYTNSLDALDYNIARGFEFFEIDFSLTKDGHLVCIHDWEYTFQKIFKFKTTEKPSLETFKFLVKHASLYRACTLEDLKIWLKQHPKTKLVTDVKEDNLKSLAIIAESFDDFQNRIIPQCYFPENYPKIREFGYKSIKYIY
jgi:glycerophosphoryl diester phosphodiesterase